MLGVKLEDQEALDQAAETLWVSALAFAEHGPRGLGLSYGSLEGRADPPLPPDVGAAGDVLLELTTERGTFFLDNVLPGNAAGPIDRGVMIGAGRRKDSAEVRGSTVGGLCLGKARPASTPSPSPSVRLWQDFALPCLGYALPRSGGISNNIPGPAPRRALARSLSQALGASEERSTIAWGRGSGQHFACAGVGYQCACGRLDGCLA